MGLNHRKASAKNGKQEAVVDSEAGSSKPGRGRPRSHVLLPEHAEAIRRAVKATARYYGIRIQDIGGGSLNITEAMRSGSALSVVAAAQLFAEIQRPRPELVGKKKPQGLSMDRVTELMMQYVRDPKRTLIPLDPTVEYFGSVFYAGLVLTRYLAPNPGSAFFVLPGAGRSIAEALTDKLQLGKISAQRRRAIVDSMAEFFELAEKPLGSELGERLIPRLTVLSLINNLEIVAAFQKVSDEDVLGLVDTIEAVEGSEERRSESLQQKPKKTAASRKRRVVMPRIKDVL
jgi:hypothetical protein